MRVGATLVLLALVAGAHVAAPPGARADVDATPRFSYSVQLVDPFADTFRVALQATGLPPGTLELRFAREADLRDVRNASWSQGTLVAEPVDGTLDLSFEVPMAARTLGFALVRLDEAIPRPTNETLAAAQAFLYYIGPEGWSAVGLEGVEGLAAFGRDLRTEERGFGGSRVMVASATPVPDETWAYLANGTPHIAAQHGAPPEGLLVIRTPPGALTEPIVVRPGIALPADADVEDLAHALVEAHQRYRVVEVVPASAAWLREGQERYHALTSLLAANMTTAEAAEQEFARARAIGDPNVTLPQAPAGSDAARQKGLVVVRALDTAIREASGGGRGLADLVAELDTTATATRVDSADIEAAAEKVAGAPLDEFFASYVYGPEWPPTAPVARAADIFLRDLRAEPPRAAPGEQVVAAFDAVNRGTSAGAVEVLVALDGAPAGSTRVELAVGERARVGTPVVAIVPGDHSVQIGGLTTTFRVLAGPSLRLDRASTTPTQPTAGEPFTLLVYVRNDGEAPATASLEVQENGRLLQRSTNATVEGGATRAITLPMRLDVAGLHALDVELLSDAGEGFLTHEVNVGPGAAAERGAPGFGAFLALAALLLIARAARP